MKLNTLFSGDQTVVFTQMKTVSFTSGSKRDWRGNSLPKHHNNGGCRNGTNKKVNVVDNAVLEPVSVSNIRFVNTGTLNCHSGT